MFEFPSIQPGPTTPDANIDEGSFGIARLKRLVTLWAFVVI
jgi:hypothetical protein